jgi:protein-L-isoaspartate(D-aspartate) O-methyltransferase
MSDPDLQAAKYSMLHKQLWQRDIHNAGVLAAMERVPRERFIPAELRNEAYADRALSIDCGQTISQPFIVALMTQALELSGVETVLEVGTGSGYQTAILAELAREVITIERHPVLSQRAGTLLDELGYRNVTLLCGDGTLGWPGRAPYDRILVTAAAAQCPPALFDQLKEGGLLVMPVGDQGSQMLQSIRKVAGKACSVNLSPCRFVPLIGEQGWPNP